MLGNYIFYRNITAGGGGGKHKGPRFDLIWYDGVFRLMKAFHAPDTDHIRTCALDIGAHAVKEIGKIHHMRLLCRIFNNGHSIRHGCGHHNIDGCAHADYVHIEMAALQLLGLRNDQAVFNAHIRTKSLEALDMLINGAASDVAAARKSDLCFIVFA